MMKNKKFISAVVVGVTIASAMLVATPVFAKMGPGGAMGMMRERGGMPGVVGKVSAVSGSTITVTDARKNVSYSVDASGAAVTKDGAASTTSNIAVGDTVMVEGTIMGTNVVAKTIRDGMLQRMMPQIQGNGQPIVAGKIATITGNTITITNASNVTYTIDASGAKFSVRGIASPTISNVAVGDSVVVQGTVNGNSVTASSIIDQKGPEKANAPNNGGQANAPAGVMNGFMGGLFHFFGHMFGF